MTRDLRTLPKAHLHVHLEGAMRPETLGELCARDGIPVPEIRGYGSFTEFAGTYLAACEVMRSPEDLRRLVFEVVEAAALAGCTWMEPAFYAGHHVDRLGQERDIWEMLVQFGADAGADFGVGVGWMAAIDRTNGDDDADHVTAMALELRAAGAPIVSFGLHNDEVGFPPELFADQFARVKAAGLLSTPHAGELEGPASVRGAIHALGADRIQHGVRAVEEPDLLREIADRGIVLDVCPTSNVMLSVVPAIEQHPLPLLLEAGIRCSINGDDPLLFGPGILEEYELCRDVLDLTDDQLAGIARTSLEGSGAPADVIAAGIADIDSWVGVRA